LYWIAITGCTGLVVGLLRYFIGYPDDLPGLFKEIATYHVDPKWSPASSLISMISLAGGMSLGPEQALASIGGGLATYISEHYVQYEDQEYKKLLVLGGMASALGALFPTPILGVLMLIELGKMPK
jgi:H+/Cl- antiporter ClcA